MKRYRVWYYIDYEVEIEAESEDDAKDAASKLTPDQWTQSESYLEAEEIAGDS